jgi:hypothetical protein
MQAASEQALETIRYQAGMCGLDADAVWLHACELSVSSGGTSADIAEWIVRQVVLGRVPDPRWLPSPRVPIWREPHRLAKHKMVDLETVPGLPAWSPITGLRTPATPPRVKPIADNAAHLAAVAAHVRWLFPMLEVEEDRARLIDALATGEVVTITGRPSGGFDVAVSRPGNASQADG